MNNEIILGQMGTDEENANYQRWRESQLKENDRRIAAGQHGDIPDELTAEDEVILTRIQKEIAQEDKQKRRRRTCPACGSSNVARILYGLIVLDEKLDRQCNDCDHKWKYSADPQ